MTSAERKRPKLGDIIEIKTPKGLVFAQFTHKHKMYGALIRVFKGFYEKRPDEFRNLVVTEPQFTLFFPLGVACSRGVVSIAANEEIPMDAKQFPVFRTGVANDAGKVEVWWLWDGTKEWKIGKLEPGMEKLPIRSVWNDTLLVQRIIEEWNHENVN